MKEFYLRHKPLILKTVVGVVIIAVALIYVMRMPGYDDHLAAGD